MVLNHASIAAVSHNNEANRFDLFALESDKRIYHKARDSQGNFVPPNPTWEALGQDLFSSPPSAVALDKNRIEVFALGDGNNQMYRYSWKGGAWSSKWQPLGGNFISQPYAVALGTDSWYVFALDANHQVSYMASNQSSWNTFSNNFASPPVAIALENGKRMDVFVLGSNERIYHKTWHQTGGWSPNWEDLGGNFLSPPCAVARNAANGSFDLFALGTNREIYYKRWDGQQWHPGSTNWAAMGGQLNSSPSGASLGPDRFAATVLQPMQKANDQVGCKDQVGTFWLPSQNGWENTGAISNSILFTSPPCALGRGENFRLDIFTLGSDRHMHYQSWDGIKWYPAQDAWQDLGGNFPEQDVMGLRLAHATAGSRP